MTPWTVTCQALLSVGFSRQEYWSALPFLSLGNLPDSGIEAGSPALQADSLLSHVENPRELVSSGISSSGELLALVTFPGQLSWG